MRLPSLFFAFVLMSSALFADEISSSAVESSSSVYIGNICDTLKLHSDAVSRTIQLRLDTIRESVWEGLLSAPGSALVTTTIHRDLRSFVPIKKDSPYSVPVAVAAQCLVSENQYTWADYSSNAWVEDSLNVNTRLYDIRDVVLGDYNSSNTYNWLAFTQGAWPTDDSFDANELMLSNTFDVHAITWHGYSIYYDTTVTVVGTSTTTKISYRIASSVALDSATVFASVTSNIPSGKLVKVQMLRIMLSDEKLIIKDQPTTIAKVPQSHYLLRYKITPTTGGYLVRGPQGEVPQMRSLKGSVVNASEAVKPGLYIVSVPKSGWQKIIIDR
ncbi:MAG: hypothetical protein WCX75_06815 [Fibrobacteraceae bacterium]